MKYFIIKNTKYFICRIAWQIHKGDIVLDAEKKHSWLKMQYGQRGEKRNALKKVSFHSFLEYTKTQALCISHFVRHYVP